MYFDRYQKQRFLENVGLSNVWMMSTKVVRVFAKIWLNSHCDSKSWTSTAHYNAVVGTICVSAAHSCEQWACS